MLPARINGLHVEDVQPRSPPRLLVDISLVLRATIGRRLRNYLSSGDMTRGNVAFRNTGALEGPSSAIVIKINIKLPFIL